MKKQMTVNDLVLTSLVSTKRQEKSQMQKDEQDAIGEKNTEWTGIEDDGIEMAGKGR